MRTSFLYVCVGPTGKLHPTLFESGVVGCLDKKWHEKEYHKEEYDHWKWPGYDPEIADKQPYQKEEPSSLSQRLGWNLNPSLNVAVPEDLPVDREEAQETPREGNYDEDKVKVERKAWNGSPGLWYKGVIRSSCMIAKVSGTSSYLAPERIETMMDENFESKISADPEKRIRSQVGNTIQYIITNQVRDVLNSVVDFVDVGDAMYF